MGKLKKTEEDLGQIKEKNIQLSDELLSKSRQLTALENKQKDEVSEVTGLRAKVADLTSKLSSKAAATSEVNGAKKKSVSFAVASPSEDNDRLASLEAALEAAASERQEILLAAEQEIEYHRSIAAELERTMIEDFEWKVHEIEADYHR